MKINPLTLQFSAELETEFRDYFYKKFLHQGRIAIISGILLYLIWGISDVLFAAENIIKQIFIIRYGIIFPVLIGVFILSFHYNFKKFIQLTWSSLILVITGSVIYISSLSHLYSAEIDNNQLHIALILVLMYTYTFILLRFIYAVHVGLIIIITYNLIGFFILKISPFSLFANNFYLISANCIGIVANYQIELFMRRIFWQTRQLKIEKQNSEKLLLNILPKSIADRLKQDNKTIADSFAHATVLFADIVGFTEISHHVSPVELVNLLNEIFSQFDYLAEKYQLEKIKTIGDAYMIVGGLPFPRKDHAQAVAKMALSMLETINIFNEKMGYDFKMRIGINSGEVVAGVIGIKKFIYDLWGDTVNIASRMESHGIPNKIQITQTTYNLLKNEFICEERGIISIKGKGDMQTYFLLESRH
jgi:class 3 adenylate cyclase